MRSAGALPVLVALGAMTAPSLAAQRPAPSDWETADSATARLAPSAFPNLPAPIRAALTDRGCLIPQSPEGTGPHNVAKGRLKGASQFDWVVLCSKDRVSRILVFWAGDTVRVDSLPPASDASFLQGMGGDSIAFSHIIGIADSSYIVRHASLFNGRLLPRPIHDGINDAFVGKASTVRYWNAGEWIDLAGAD